MIIDRLQWTEKRGGHTAVGEPGASKPARHLDAVQGGSRAWPTAAARLNDLFHCPR